MRKLIFFDLEGPDDGFELDLTLKVRADGGGSVVVKENRASGGVSLTQGASDCGTKTPDGYLVRPVDHREGDTWEWRPLPPLLPQPKRSG